MTLKQPVILTDPDILGGTPVFVGTRVPVQALLDYLEGGDSLDEFLDHFPSVNRVQAVAALELARTFAPAFPLPPIARENYRSFLRHEAPLGPEFVL
jgi:uncharacterized protein (DUF433 family)